MATPTVGQQSTPPSSDAAQKFATLSDQFMKDSLALSPVSASAAGYHKIDLAFTKPEEKKLNLQTRDGYYTGK